MEEVALKPIIPTAAMDDLSAVIAGLDPAIHHIETTLVFLMDARVKPAHDESKSETVGITRAVRH